LDKKMETITALKKQSIDVLLRTYVLSTKVPTDVVYSEHMPRFQGFEPFRANPDLVWGVQGTNSINSADAYASMDARHLRRKVFLLDLHFKIANVTSASSVITEEAALKSGYYHFDRLEFNFRAKLFKVLLGYIEESKQEAAKKLTIQDLLREQPMLIHRFMKETPECRACLHSVQINGGVTLRMATVRKNMAFVERVGVRYHDDINVTL